MRYEKIYDFIGTCRVRYGDYTTLYNKSVLWGTVVDDGKSFPSTDVYTILYVYSRRMGNFIKKSTEIIRIYGIFFVY